MNFTPSVPQQAGIDHGMAHPRCALWASMGIGKTAVTLELARRRLHVCDVLGVLVVAPLRVATGTWPNEIHKWAEFQGLSYQVIRGTADERIAQMQREVDIHIINFELFQWLVEQAREMKHWPWDMLVIDEASRMRTASAEKFKAARRVAFQYVTHVVELTGTPAPNGLHNLWGQLYLLDRGERLHNTLGKFRSRWFHHDINRHKYIPHKGAEGEIMDKVKDLCLTLDAKDYHDLTEPVIRPVWVELEQETLDAYRQLETDMYIEVESVEMEAFDPGVLTNKCRQYLNGFLYIEEVAHLVHTAKLQALDSIVEEANGMPLLVVYAFRPDRERILSRYKGAEAISKDPKQVDRWNAGDIPMLVVHPDSAGHGLNLQHGSNITVWFGLTWDLEQYEQVNERLGPMRQKQAGLDRLSYYYHILVPDTVDTAMSDRLVTKCSVQDAIKNAAKRERIAA